MISQITTIKHIGQYAEESPLWRESTQPFKTKRQIILLFNNAALNWSKVTVSAFIMLQKVSILNAVLFNFHKKIGVTAFENSAFAITGNKKNLKGVIWLMFFLSLECYKWFSAYKICKVGEITVSNPKRFFLKVKKVPPF